jgi:hypothetical protein
MAVITSNELPRGSFASSMGNSVSSYASEFFQPAMSD